MGRTVEQMRSINISATRAKAAPHVFRLPTVPEKPAIRSQQHFGFGPMPALDNPRWERFAQAIVEGLANGDRKPYSQGRAYIAAGYTAKDQGKRGGSAECAASRLLNRVKPILERVRELQAIAARNAAETAEKMARELNEIQYEARADKAHAAAVSAVLGKARILNIVPDESAKPIDFAQAKSMQDIGRKLLQSVGFSSPDDVSIQAAIEANDAFIERLEAIRDAAQVTIDQDN
jgi:hypothetical protein